MLSVIILTKNEENLIVDCIESIKGFADEIIVIDSDSEDRTREIAEKLGARVFQHTFVDFSDQRNFGAKNAQGDWILYLDADERATPEFKNEVKEVIVRFDKNSETHGYFIRRKTFFYGKDWHHSDKVQRLFYKEFLKGWKGAVHETPKIEGKFSEILFPIFHFTHRDLSEMVEKTNEWSEVEAELRYKVHHPKMATWRFFRVMTTGFLKSYIFEKGYKNGTGGLVEAMYQAFSMFITYAKLWEKQVGESVRKK